MFVIAIIIIIISECALRRFFIRENELFPRSLSVGRGEPSKQTRAEGRGQAKRNNSRQSVSSLVGVRSDHDQQGQRHGKLRCTLDLMPAADPHDPDIRG